MQAAPEITGAASRTGKRRDSGCLLPRGRRSTRLPAKLITDEMLCHYTCRQAEHETAVVNSGQHTRHSYAITLCQRADHEKLTVQPE